MALPEFMSYLAPRELSQEPPRFLFGGKPRVNVDVWQLRRPSASAASSSPHGPDKWCSLQPVLHGRRPDGVTAGNRHAAVSVSGAPPDG
jgi:hypothetical protein